MTLNSSPIAIVYPSGRVNQTQDEKELRLKQLRECGLAVEDLAPSHSSENGYTAGPILERATTLAMALTQRKYKTLWAARGGFGVSEILPYLEHMLPPIIPHKTFVGFSDASLLGTYLSSRFPNLNYVHANHAYDKGLWTQSKWEREKTFDLILQKPTAGVVLPSEFALGFSDHQQTVDGFCVPFNLSLIESFCTIPNIKFPSDSILFIEDLNEDLFRLIRKFDSLILSRKILNIKALVLGEFTRCPDATGKNTDIKYFMKILHEKTKLPIISLPVFGHDSARLPLVNRAPIQVRNFGKTIHLSFEREKSTQFTAEFQPETYLENLNLNDNKNAPNIYFSGIGGTGMAAVAGIFKEAGYNLLGSDNPIYPPMDRIIKNLGIEPFVGFSPENIEKSNPDAIILANVLSRRNAELKSNSELEHILTKHIPLFSFPSALRKFFLNHSENIVVAGTHGKTTTTSIIAHMMSHIGLNPSFLIGGSPKNFASGFALNSKKLFVLEGDEYDSAFFDKGPKFLHYEPTISLLNNIEFDHADIYENVEAIEKEFSMLTQLTHERMGIVVANFDDIRVRNICSTTNSATIRFTSNIEFKSTTPTWYLVSKKTIPDGMILKIRSPNNISFDVKIPVFGHHNAMNTLGVFAVLTAYSYIQHKKTSPKTNSFHFQHYCDYINSLNLNFFVPWIEAASHFQGVRRRFELVKFVNDIAVFDDFAHHPTAIETTLEAFRDYMKASSRGGRLIACFDPRNATMRRNILGHKLAESFSHADLVFLGKVPKDLRLAAGEALDGESVAKECGKKAKYFDDNTELCHHLSKVLKSGDTIVFMSSGAFDGLPLKLASMLEN